MTVKKQSWDSDAALTHTSKVRFPWLVCVSKMYQYWVFQAKNKKAQS